MFALYFFKVTTSLRFVYDWVVLVRTSTYWLLCTGVFDIVNKFLLIRINKRFFQIDQLMKNKDLLQILESLLIRNGKKIDTTTEYQYQYLDESELQELGKKYVAKVIPMMTNSDFLELLIRNSHGRYSENFNESDSGLKEKVINAICDPEIIKAIKTNLLRNFKFLQ